MLQTRIDTAVAQAPRYRAFLSYSHADERRAAVLHKALETYRLPRRLHRRGESARPLHPIFRDRDEFPAGTDLSAAIVDALSDSAAMIVLCSPAAAHSEWVGQEITLFRSLRPDAPILAVILDGEPFASRNPANEARECFPPAFRDPAAGREPIAADLRPGGDGERLVKLKLVAGITGLRLDDLVQRDAERRQQRLFLVAASAIAAAAVLAVMLAFALSARREAEVRREQAEGLVEFLVADLREKLEPVGRLELMDVIASRALHYYQQQKTKTLDPDALARRARVLILTGQVQSARGNLAQARASFENAAASTGELVERFPDDGQRIFDHAQSVFYVADTDRNMGLAQHARVAFEEYRRLAERLVAISPERADWLAELGYAEGNVGVLLYERGRYDQAKPYLIRSLSVAQRLAKRRPSDSSLQIELAQASGWVGDVAAKLGDVRRAIAERSAELAIYDRLLATEPENQMIIERRITAERMLANYARSAGDLDRALMLGTDAVDRANALSNSDPQNMEWFAGSVRALLALSEVQLAMGSPSSASVSLARADRRIERLLGRKLSAPAWQTLRAKSSVIAAEIACSEGLPDAAHQAALNALRALHKLPVDQQSSGESILINKRIRLASQCGGAIT